MSQSSRDFKSHVSASSTTPAQKQAKRVERSTSTLGKSRSTIELHPRNDLYEIRTHVTSVKERYPGPLDEEVLLIKISYSQILNRRRERDSDAQGCYARRFSKSLPSPIGLSPQIVLLSSASIAAVSRQSGILDMRMFCLPLGQVWLLEVGGSVATGKPLDWLSAVRESKKAPSTKVNSSNHHEEVMS